MPVGILSVLLLRIFVALATPLVACNFKLLRPYHFRRATFPHRHKSKLALSTETSETGNLSSKRVS
jgi:hypothetical protein